LTYSAPASTAKAAVSINASTGAFTYTPTTTARQNAGKTGATAADKADSFTVTVTDGYGGTTTAAVTVAVSPVAINRAPVAGIPTVGNPNASTGVITGAVKATDADGDLLTYLGSTTTSKGSAVVTAGGAFTYTPTATARHAAAKNGATTAEKTDSFTVTVSDGKGGTAIVPVTVAISPTNAAPIAGTPSSTTNPTTGIVSGNVNAVDPDKDALTYVAGSATTAKGTATVTASGAYTYTPTTAARDTAAGANASIADKSDSFAVTAIDGYGGTSDLLVTVPISPKSNAPVMAQFVTSFSTVEEGNSGTTTLPVKVQLSAASSQSVTVNYTVSNWQFGNAASSGFFGGDYLAESGSVTFAPGQTETAFNVKVLGDTRYEPDELFRVDLTGATGAAVNTQGNTYNIVTIKNDDAPSPA
jgi:VCBS repeat-containing protein